MAVMCVLLAGRHRNAVHRFIPVISENSRVLVGLYSRAAQQCSSDTYCHDNDCTDEPSHLVTVRALEEKYNKALADVHTVRRRTQKFVEDAKLFGIQSFCRDLVEVADLLEKTAGGPEGEGAQGIPEELTEIRNRLQCIFAKHGLKKMDPVGCKYDPYDHEIVCHLVAEGAEPGTVAIVKQHGYKLHGRTIRHAHVGIALESQDH
ncbi:grpE protein homolog 2, mitochondrial-like isoform X2 [Scleropages formosus]|uniref:grpE protein homolog 2, mitochondrial-like isoform X2 n=1 Tax=Scleropages formosus TaxID=113540 RepID=UPI00087881D5|nr:grpE protein homolog 2, mitochondrial-like isoform X2 [Scleropages formosus]